MFAKITTSREKETSTRPGIFLTESFHCDDNSTLQAALGPDIGVYLPAELATLYSLYKLVFVMN
ncbi:hypothetical protein J6590_087762 [Homalodisca vitripennis]|nr:hypothetical protein J6590_087762 [Homalodisca vitripennis]